MTDIATLTREESIALADCEERIERGLKTFIEVGSALAAIRDSKLYRADYETFEAYAKGRWNLSRPRAYELMTAAEVVSGMPDTAAPITSARQATELARVPEPERAEVWAETVERTNGKPTAAAVRAVSEEQRKRAEEQRDARALLSRGVDLLAPPGWMVPLGDGTVVRLGDMNRARIAMRRDMRRGKHEDETRAYAAEVAFWERIEQLLQSGETVEGAILRSQAVSA